MEMMQMQIHQIETQLKLRHPITIAEVRQCKLSIWADARRRRITVYCCVILQTIPRLAVCSRLHQHRSAHMFFGPASDTFQKVAAHTALKQLKATQIACQLAHFRWKGERTRPFRGLAPLFVPRMVGLRAASRCAVQHQAGGRG